MTSSPPAEIPATPSVLIVGIGNDIRNDDAVGLVVARHVAKVLGASRRNVVVKTLSAGGWQLLDEIEGFDQLIIIDAYYTASCRPGRVRILTPDDVLPIRDTDATAAHLLSVPDALRISMRFGYHTPKLLGVVAIDVGENCLSFGTGLSNPVKAAVMPAVHAVIGLIPQ